MALPWDAETLKIGVAAISCSSAIGKNALSSEGSFRGGGIVLVLLIK